MSIKKGAFAPMRLELNYAPQAVAGLPPDVAGLGGGAGHAAPPPPDRAQAQGYVTCDTGERCVDLFVEAEYRRDDTQVY